MTNRVKLKFKSAQRWITYVLRLSLNLVLVIGGLYALTAPPQSIIESLGHFFIGVMGYCLVIGGGLGLVGWGFGIWYIETMGSVAAAAGALLYFWSIAFTPDILSIGGGLRVALTIYVVLSTMLRIFEIERYTSILVRPARMVHVPR